MTVLTGEFWYQFLNMMLVALVGATGGVLLLTALWLLFALAIALVKRIAGDDFFN